MNYQLQNKYVQDLFTKAEKCALTHQRSDLAESIDTIRKQLSSQKLSVVVCGEFKRGKSSLINALVGVNKLCPVALSITTNLVTEVTYGEVEKIMVVMYTRKGEERKEIMREQIADYVTEKGNPNNQKQVQSLMIEIPSPLLADGLVLIDTPGIGGVNSKHTIVTKESLKFADVILFVSDTSRPLLQPDLDFIQNNIGDRVSHALFVVTRLDEVGREKCEPIVTSNRKKISEVSGRSLASIPIVPVSSRMKLSYLDSGNEDHLAESNFAELEKSLWETIDLYRAQVTMSNSLTELEDLVLQVQLPILAEKAAYEQEEQGNLAEYLRQVQELEQKLNNLLLGGSTWQQELATGMDDVANELEAVCKNGFNRISSKIGKYVNEASDLSNPYQVIQPVATDIASLVNSLFTSLTEQSLELTEKLQNTTELSLNQAKVRQISYSSPTPQTSAITISRKSDQELLQIAQGKAQNSDKVHGEDLGGRVVGALFGCVATAFTGNPMFIAVGIEAGGSIARNNAMATETEQELAKLKSEEIVSEKKLQTAAANSIIQRYIVDSQQSLISSLEKNTEKLKEMIEKDLKNKIAQEQRNCEQVVKSVKEAANKSQLEIDRRMGGLNKEILLIVNLQQEIVDMKSSLMQS